MNLTNNNFGLSGQRDFDYFIFCGKKCKKRRAERLKVRLEKKRLKNDERRAETERVRAETALMKKGFESEVPVQDSPPPKPTAPVRASSPVGGIKKPPPRPYYVPPPVVQASAAPKKAGLGNTPLLLIGLVVIGGIGLVLSRRRNNLQPISLAK